MRFLIVMLVILVSACASSKIRQIHAADLKDYGDTPLFHTLYQGSDQDFHYFVWSGGKSRGRGKVLKSELPFATDWPLTEGRSAFLMKDQQGRLQPYTGRRSPWRHASVTIALVSAAAVLAMTSP